MLGALECIFRWDIVHLSLATYVQTPPWSRGLPFYLIFPVPLEYVHPRGDMEACVYIESMVLGKAPPRDSYDDGTSIDTTIDTMQQAGGRYNNRCGEPGFTLNNR